MNEIISDTNVDNDNRNKILGYDEFKNINSKHIQIALQFSPNQMLTIKEFINKTEYPIDKFMVDNFFHNLDDDIPIYVNSDLIEWCGYLGELKKQKQSFQKLLQYFKENKDYWIYSNSEYSEYYNQGTLEGTLINMSNYPNPSEFEKITNIKHIIVTTECFKKILMMLKTNKADQIRDYYIGLENLIKIYAKYQNYWQRTEVALRNDKITLLIGEMKLTREELKETRIELKETRIELKETNEQVKILNENLDVEENKNIKTNKKLDKATDERAPKTTSIIKHGMFALVKLNNTDAEYPYYVIRAQISAVRTAIKKLKKTNKNAKTLLKINYSPNAVNLFNLVKEHLKNKIFVMGNNLKLLNDYTEKELLKDINIINNEKKKVEV